MSKFPEALAHFPLQLAVVSVSVIALTGAAVSLSERARHAAEQRADAAARAAAPVEADAPASDETAPEVAAAEPAPQAHGDAGSAPIASIIAGAAIAQSVDSPALDVVGVAYGLGRAALPEEVAAWDIDVRPDGQGLPEGSGDVWTGEEVFIDNCAVCHGDFAEGVDRWPGLAGGLGSLTHDRPHKTVGSYWPYLSTVYDYINRAMPYGYAQSLEPDQIYAITAYLLYSNGIVEDDFVLSNENFTEVRLPNEENFFLDDRAETELPAFTRAPCMVDCKDSVEVTMRAMVLDVTPQTEGSATTAAALDLEGVGGAAAEPAEASGEEVAAVAQPEADGGAPEVQAEPEAAAGVVAAALDPELLAQGERAFGQCKACHMIGENAANRVGPHLNDVFGRTAGTIEGFRYSRQMVEAGEGGLVWTTETLHDFLSQPRDYVQGTKMSFAGFRNEEDIAAVTAYLGTHSD